MSENMFCPAHKSNSRRYKDEYGRIFGKKSVTVWYMLDKDGEWKRNHVEMDWNFDDKPKPVNKMQEISWQNQQWKKELTLMVDGRIEDHG